MPDLTEEQMERIRSELRYAQLVLGGNTPRKARFDRVLGFTGNAFVLALMGVLFTYFVGPTLQRRYEAHTRRKQAAQECFTEFMKYATSPFEEYYATLPLANKSHIDEKEFDEYQGKVTAIHLQRFQAYARIQGLLTVLRDHPSGVVAAHAVDDYAVLVREFADKLDDWLNQLRCQPHCADDGSKPMRLIERYEIMHKALHSLEPREDVPIELILKLESE